MVDLTPSRGRCPGSRKARSSATKARSSTYSLHSRQAPSRTQGWEHPDIALILESDDALATGKGIQYATCPRRRLSGHVGVPGGSHEVRAAWGVRMTCRADISLSPRTSQHMRRKPHPPASPRVLARTGGAGTSGMAGGSRRARAPHAEIETTARVGDQGPTVSAPRLGDEDMLRLLPPRTLRRFAPRPNAARATLAHPVGVDSRPQQPRRHTRRRSHWVPRPIGAFHAARARGKAHPPAGSCFHPPPHHGRQGSQQAPPPPPPPEGGRHHAVLPTRARAASCRNTACKSLPWVARQCWSLGCFGVGRS